jgi:hypothetical protein|tara:strand:+ start:2882 stop:4354 length:1473 start_codon:yes stop_codon:yes gene_type:complete
MTTLDLGGMFYQSESLPIAAQESVNLYLNIPQAVSPTKKNLFPTPGLTAATTAGTGVVNRGGHVFQGVPYVVNGTGLYRIDRTTDAFAVDSYAAVLVSGATLLPGTGRVIMSDNGAEGAQICIVLPDQSNKFNAYNYSIAGGLVQISDSDFDGPVSSVDYVDGYFLFAKQDSQKQFISNLRNGTAYTATDFVLVESDPDSLVRMFILNNEPIGLGSETFEPFQNIGGAGFPFQRVSGGVQSKGLVSKFAIVEVNDLMIFLGSSVNETPAIWITDGGRPNKLSTTAIDNAIAKYSDTVTSTAFAFRYSQSGAQFAGFTFPSQKTFIYDFTAEEWHTRESVNSGGGATPYRVTSVMDAYGVLLVGDAQSTNIGVLDQTAYTEYGEILRRRFVIPQLDNEGQPFNIDALELWGEHGVGLSNGQGSDPQVLMSFSTNGGRTFNNTIARAWGKIGEYDHRTIWNSLGRVSREICVKFEVSDPVKWVFAKVEAQLE